MLKFKRKRDGEEMKLLKKKYKRLKKQLTRNRKYSSSSTSDTESEYGDDEAIGDDNQTRLVYSDDNPDITVIPEEPIIGHDEAQDLQTNMISNNETQVEEDCLNPEILEMLGDDTSEEKLQGKNIHKDLLKRWQHILLKGLTKEEKLALIKAHLPPGNCPALIPPKLNVEIESALLEAEKKKDAYSQSKQSQVASCLAAIGSVLDITIKDKGMQELIRPLSDASRLLCDIYYRETLTRRFTITNTLNRTMQETIKNTEVDEYLFGSGLAKHIESSKAIYKSANELKKVRTLTNSNTRNKHNNRSLNVRGAPPQPPISNWRTNPIPRRTQPYPQPPVQQLRAPPQPRPQTRAPPKYRTQQLSGAPRNSRYRERKY